MLFRSRLEVSGLPAIRRSWRNPQSYYHEDGDETLEVSSPVALNNWYEIEILYREPGGATARAAIEALFASVRIGPDPLPSINPAAGPEVLGRFLGVLRRETEQSEDAGSFYDCFPASPGLIQLGRVSAGPNGITTAPAVDVSCTTSIRPAGPRFWVAALRMAWVGSSERPAGQYTETYWLSPDGEVANIEREGDPPH